MHFFRAHIADLAWCNLYHNVSPASSHASVVFFGGRAMALIAFCGSSKLTGIVLSFIYAK